MNKVPMTKNGLRKLQKELEKLKNITRPKIINEIAIARSYGDLKENSEYQAAKEQQYITESKIKLIEEKILNAEIIDINEIQNNGKIVFGSTINLTNLENNTTFTYKIVGEDEANIKNSKISITSPIARALIGKSTKEIIEIKVPKGTVKYKINSIEYI